ncbi:MAG: radical SAM protein [Desulfobacterales bacterium]|nr:radical SAM protein [Desulfobacterales bacterium]
MDDGSLPEDRWYMPLDLLTVATAAENTGCKTAILDGGILSFNEISKVIGRDVDVVGFSYSVMSVRNLEKLARLAHERGSLVVLGGQAATASAASLAREPFVDIVIAGDGEPAICEIANQIAHDKWNPTRIPNSLSFSGNKFLKGPVAEIPSDDIGKFSRFAGSVNPEDYIGEFAEGNTLKNISAVRAANIFSKRGCHGRCSFCGRTDKRIRARNPSEILAEIHDLTHSFHLDYIIDHSDTWMSDISWVRRFVAERSKMDIGLPNMMIFADSRHLNTAAIDLLPKAGIDNVLLGVESASKRILLKNGKPNSKRKVFDVIQRLVDKEIKVSASFVLGLIGEDDASLAETCSFAEQLSHLSGVRCYCNVIIPLPGSPAWAEFMASGVGERWSRALDYRLDSVREDFIRTHTRITGGLDRLLKERDIILANNDLRRLEFAR